MKSLVALVVALVLSHLVSRGAEPAKLNLLYITADDMNADSPGWMGGKMGATPTLDTLAETCHRFIHNHVTAPICQPSREAMMTGRVPHRSGALGFNPVKPGTPTMVTVLKSAGYFTAANNKTAHMKPEAEFPWDEKTEGSGKNPPLLREHFEGALQRAADAKKPFFINVNIQYPHRPFPGSRAADAEEGDSLNLLAKVRRRRPSPSRAGRINSPAKRPRGSRAFTSRKKSRCRIFSRTSRPCAQNSRSTGPPSHRWTYA